MGSRVCGAVGRRRRHGARGAHCCYLPCKIQNSKFGRGCGQILNFEFCGVGSQSSSVAVVASSRCCYLPCKNQNSKFGRGCGQILNFDFCGFGSQSSPSSCRVVSCRVGRRRVGRRRLFWSRPRPEGLRD